MEITSTTFEPNDLWTIAPTMTTTSWRGGDQQEQGQSDAEVQQRLFGTAKQPTTPDPAPGHVDFYA